LRVSFGFLLGCELLLRETARIRQAKIKKPRDPWGSRGQFWDSFALSNFSLYLIVRAIRPWPLPNQGKRYVKANQ